MTQHFDTPRTSGAHGPEGADFVMRPSGSQYWQEPASQKTADAQSPYAEQSGRTNLSFMEEMGEAMRYDPDVLKKLQTQYPDRAEELERTLVWGGAEEGWLLRAELPGAVADEGAQEGYVKIDIARGIMLFGGTNQATTIAAAGLAEKAIVQRANAAVYNPNGTTALAAPPRALPPAPVRPKPPTTPVAANTAASNAKNTKNNEKQDTPNPSSRTNENNRNTTRRRVIVPVAIAAAILGSSYSCSQDFKDGFVDASGSTHPWRDIGNAVTFIPKKLPIIGGFL